MATDPDDPTAAREHLANERTVLAWVRTGITLAALGFALARFGGFLSRNRDRLDGGPPLAPTALGLALIGAGLACAVVGFVRFRRNRAGIRRRAFRSEMWAEAALTAVLVGFGVCVVAYVLATP